MGETYTFKGSISGYSKTITIASANPIKVMPDGALYWYGNECVEVTGGFSYDGYNYSTAENSNTITLGSNKIDIASSGEGYIAVFGSINKIDFSKNRKINILEKSDANYGFLIGVSSQKSSCNDYKIIETVTTQISSEEKVTSVDISNIDTSGYLYLVVGKRSIQSGMYVKQIWLE